MTTQIPSDVDGVPIPALRLKPGGSHALAVTAACGRLGPFDPETRVVSLFATGPVFLRTGQAGVVASTGDHYFPDGIYCTLSLGGSKTDRHTHIAAVAAAANCNLYVSELE